MDENNLPKSKYFDAKPYFSFNQRYYKAIDLEKNVKSSTKKLLVKEISKKKESIVENKEVIKFILENKDILPNKDEIEINENCVIGKFKGRSRKY